MASPAGAKRPGGANIMKPLQAGSTFAVHDGDGVPDNSHELGLTHAGGSGVFGGVTVPGSPGDADVEPPTSLNGATFAGTKGMALSSGPDDDAPTVPVTSSGGSKSGGATIR